MKKPKSPFRRNKRGASYSISAIIITVTTLTLVLVSASYAYQLLSQQRGMSEFDIAKKSIIAFDDAIRDVAWDLKGSRSVRFTVDYGQLDLMPSDLTFGLPLKVNVTDYQNASYSSRTGYVKYSISTNYVNLGSEYQSYLLGDNTTITTDGVESYGCILGWQEPSWVNIILDYGVRAMKTSTVNVTQGANQTTVSYVDIWIIKIDIASWSRNIGTFDLKAKSSNLTTISYGGPEDNGYPVQNGECTIDVQLGTASNTATIPIDGERVVFNFIISELEVTT